MEAQSAALCMSDVTVAEIEDGIAKLQREGATRKSADLAEWLKTVMYLYGDRILSFDIQAARIAGRLSDRARELGHAPGFVDILIAATAPRHQLRRENSAPQMFAAETDQFRENRALVVEGATLALVTRMNRHTSATLGALAA